ncbi:MAG: hypothetical protein AAB368_01990, partial [bacterium]
MRRLRRFSMIGALVIGWLGMAAFAAVTTPGPNQPAVPAARPAATPQPAVMPRPAVTPPGGRVVSVQISSTSPTQVVLSILLAGPVRHAVYRVADTPRVVIELANAVYAAPKEVAVAHPVIKKIRGGQYLEKPVRLSRIIVDASRAMTPVASQQGDRLIVTLTIPAEPGSPTVIKPVIPAAVVAP